MAILLLWDLGAPRVLWFTYDHLYMYTYIYTSSLKLRSCSSKAFYEVSLLKNFTKFTGKHLCRNLFLTIIPA